MVEKLVGYGTLERKESYHISTSDRIAFRVLRRIMYLLYPERIIRRSAYASEHSGEAASAALSASENGALPFRTPALPTIHTDYV